MRSTNALRVVLSFDSPLADVNVSTYVLAATSRRGRPPGGPTRAGQCDITLLNTSRLFDPPWPGATPGALGWIRPGQHVQMFYDSVPIFDGHVDDWDHDYPVSGPPTATLHASDALARLAQRQIAEWLPDPCQRINTRLTAMLARPEIAWVGTTDFDSGAMSLQADFVADKTNALTYSQLLEITDGGRFFASAANALTYRGLNRATAASTLVTFTDDLSGVHGLHDVVVNYDSEEWYTQVNVTREDGDTQTATSASPVTDLHDGGYRPLDLDGLLMGTDAASMNLAEYKLSVYEDNTPDISQLRCVLDALTTAQALDVAALEIGDQVEVQWTPTRSGNAADQTLAVEGAVDVFTPDIWTRTLSLSRLIGLPSWVIGTSQIGTGVLGI